MSTIPTTWRTTPVCATEAMIEAGREAIRNAYPWLSNPEACNIAACAWNAMSAASPKPPLLPEPPATGDADHD